MAQRFEGKWVDGEPATVRLLAHRAQHLAARIRYDVPALFVTLARLAVALWRNK